MKKRSLILRSIVLFNIFISAWVLLSPPAAILAATFFAWMLFPLEYAILGFIGGSCFAVGIVLSLFNAAGKSEALLNYGFFFMFLLTITGLRDISRNDRQAHGKK